ncbi:transglutaminase-like domain-containing protein [Lichenibacterium dinghuense]|uniref:transglutaminase-like domain-containing protein n=1 Tax=Lichenibacterium dinghuense TaxID=2895977 RepID=UPI001F38590F|nr:transglutaminase family protein [Lichenibacterium sp. 6Y81]
MRIRLGCEMAFQLPNPTPIIMMLNVHHSRAGDLDSPDRIAVEPAVPIEGFRDGFGNWCTRVMAPAGRFAIRVDGVIRDAGDWDAVDTAAVQHRVEDLPTDVLGFLLPSRYCESDALSNEAWRLFGHTAPDWHRAKAIVDFVHGHIAFNYQNARNTRTAAEAYAEGTGVCRDFAHLAVAFCRAMNIPTRYCTGYISDIGLPPPYAPGDFAAWMECYLGGRWHMFDPRNNAPRKGRVLMAYGRDAADVALTHTFGSSWLQEFRVWTDEVPEAADAPAPAVAAPEAIPIPAE